MPYQIVTTGSPLNQGVPGGIDRFQFLMVRWPPYSPPMKEAHENTTLGAALRRGTTDHSWWREQPSSGVSLGGRATSIH
ncbi:hypothetical protein NSPZN2_11343 [Nitrospira defluvii]|uniref:Uncharacterized protein n=1 Tax=Nitrospira defluvii TaxID=330214 RepID=A0ABM8QSW9_9BACT|nr:hypothetical protein NSPZN2_11343 [Nitrospira defluvii]